jgi:CTP synthase
LGEVILQKLKLKKRRDDFQGWSRWVKKIKNLSEEVQIGIVGKYVSHADSYKSLFEALFHAGAENNVKVKLKMVEADDLLSGNLVDVFQHAHGILIPGGFGIRGIEGMIKAAEFARNELRPFFGICLGMQVATVEFARNVIGFKNAHSAEFDAKTSQRIFLKLKELIHVEEMGHNMRLGSYSCALQKGSLAFSIYKKLEIHERHRHRYEFNPIYEKDLESHGMRVSGKNLERNLVEIVELPGHPWFIGCQFHPEFRSKPLQPHPLFVAFIGAAKNVKGTSAKIM